MAIEVNGKTYRYYPYDAYYVNGTQVREAWFNGVKYYPEEYDEYIWSGTSTCVAANSGACRVSFTRNWQWGVTDGAEYIIRYETNARYPTTTRPTSGVWSHILSYHNLFSWDSPPHYDPIFDVQHEQATVTVNFGQFAWLRDYMTAGGQAVYDALTSGLTVSGAPRKFKFTPSGVVPSGKHEWDMDVNGLYLDAAHNIRFYCSAYSADATSGGYVGYDSYYSVLDAYMPLDPNESDDEVTISDGKSYMYVRVHLASMTSARLDSIGVTTAISSKPRPRLYMIGWQTRNENFTYEQVI